MKNIVIIGATGFGGLGLIEILLKHPGFQIQQLIARKDTGKKVSEIFPHLNNYCDLIIDHPDDIKYHNIDLAFFSTPDRAGMTLINEFHKKKIPVIDFSGDFRFNNINDYILYATNKGMETEHFASNMLNESIYGLPELNYEKIKSAKVIGNPGCFAIAMILGLLPAIQNELIISDTIICDGKTGVSGAGKNSGETNLYPQRHENVNTYREGKHQHLVEVENIINHLGKKEKKILFVPQIVPLNRGILITTYADVKSTLTTNKAIEIYKDYYKNKPFINVINKSPNTANVRGSNRCEIRPFVDDRTGKFIIISVIDNLIKGQSGNAVQNANIMFGFDETTGLDHPAFYP